MGTDVLKRNQVTVSGAGEITLVFAHGFGCSQLMWRFVLPAFTSKYRVVTFDYVGCGNSALEAYDPERYASLGGYAQDVEEICDALAMRDAVFIGHSVSCMIGTLVALRRPELFRSLVLLSPSPRYLNDPPGYIGGFERRDIDELLKLMEQNFLTWASTFADVAARDPERALELRRSFSATDPKSLRQFAEVTLLCDVRAELCKLDKPCLVLQCRDDDIAPVCVGEYVHRQIAHSEYSVLELSGHCPQMTHPDLVAARILQYLEASTKAAA